LLAKVGVERSNRFTRSILSKVSKPRFAGAFVRFGHAVAILARCNYQNHPARSALNASCSLASKRRKRLQSGIVFYRYK
jgi:hypothetical protein